MNAPPFDRPPAPLTRSLVLVRSVVMVRSMVMVRSVVLEAPGPLPPLILALAGSWSPCPSPLCGCTFYDLKADKKLKHLPWLKNYTK